MRRWMTLKKTTVFTRWLSLAMGVDTAIKIEAIETPLRKKFNQILREQGMKAALAWREQRLKQSS